MPNVVKGSKQERMVVVPYRPGRRLLAAVALVALLIGGTLTGHWLGVRETGFAGGNLSAAGQRLADLEAENASLRQELALLERGSVMDQQANSEIQVTMTELREYIASLEKNLQYYRQAMTDEFADVGLVVGQMDLERAGSERRFRYKLVMRQEESDGDYLTGHVNVEVVGNREGQRVSIPLRDLTEDENQLDIKLRFRYFQNIEGELELLPGFVPEQIEVKAVATAPMAKSVSKAFDWVVEGE
ncbi:MAG: DUF6776 family protein [Gammaproteobacteria bacterium]